MRKLFLPFIIIAFCFSLESSMAQSKVKPKPKTKASLQKKSAPKRIPRKRAPINRVAATYNAGLKAFRAKDFERASVLFHSLAYKKKDDRTRLKSRYYLGVSLYRLGLKQVAAFPLMSVAIQGDKDTQKRALDVLVAISNHLEDQDLLNYALDKVRVDDISEISKEAFYLLLGDKLLNEGKLTQAADAFEKSLEHKGDNSSALYRLGLVYLKLKKPEVALNYFNRLWDKTKNLSVTDDKRGMAIISRARALYQAKKFQEAAELYAEIPKDHPFYRESQLELAWSHFRSSRLRSSLGTLHTLHTPYYENFWDPESLVLRSLILLFVCQYDELEKAWNTFDLHYNASYQALKGFLEGPTDLNFIFQEVQKTQRHLERIKNWKDEKYPGELPFFVVRTLIDDAAIKPRINYLERLNEEKLILSRLKPKIGRVFRFGQEILETRQKNTRGQIAKMIKARAQTKFRELADFSTQMDFIKYEMLNGKRIQLKKKMSVNYVDKGNEKIEREVLVENGYRYWPFQGEYWRDEIGNYQYFGRNRCE